MRIDIINHTNVKGKWIPLGHRMGTCSHPLSEDYQCSFCGYIQYTLFFLPPKRCPACTTEMENGDDKSWIRIGSL